MPTPSTATRERFGTGWGASERSVSSRESPVPTDGAYDVLGIERLEDAATTPVEREGTPVEDVTVAEIDLSSVANPELCRAELVIRGPVGPFDAGDRVTVGPTPATGLRLSGVVDATNVGGNTLLVRVDGMETPTGGSAA